MSDDQTVRTSSEITLQRIEAKLDLLLPAIASILEALRPDSWAAEDIRDYLRFHPAPTNTNHY